MNNVVTPCSAATIVSGRDTSPRTMLDTGRQPVGGYAGVARDGADLLAGRRQHVDKGPADGAGCAGYKYHG